jgi:hypothetical protein
VYGASAHFERDPRATSRKPSRRTRGPWLSGDRSNCKGEFTFASNAQGRTFRSSSGRALTASPSSWRRSREKSRCFAVLHGNRQLLQQPARTYRPPQRQLRGRVLPMCERGPNDRNRRISPIAARFGKGLLTEPTTAAQPCRREPLFIVLLSTSLLWALGPPVASAARTITTKVSRNRMAHLPSPGA